MTAAARRCLRTSRCGGPGGHRGPCDSKRGRCRPAAERWPVTSLRRSFGSHLCSSSRGATGGCGVPLAACGVPPASCGVPLAAGGVPLAACPPVPLPCKWSSSGSVVRKFSSTSEYNCPSRCIGGWPQLSSCRFTRSRISSASSSSAPRVGHRGGGGPQHAPARAGGVRLVVGRAAKPRADQRPPARQPRDASSAVGTWSKTTRSGFTILSRLRRRRARGTGPGPSRTRRCPGAAPR